MDLGKLVVFVIAAGVGFGQIPSISNPPTSAGSGVIANGSTALGTGALATGVCASPVTTSATGATTASSIAWAFNADPSSLTGYSGNALGNLTIYPFPTTNNVNFTVCNNTTIASITPGAVTLNWSVLPGGIPPVPPIALIGHTGAPATSNPFTTSTVNMTTADLLVIATSNFSSIPTVSDSLSNTWTALTDRANGSNHNSVFYAKNATVGAAQTFTVTGTSFGSVCVMGFSNANKTAPFDLENGASGTSATAQPGSVTPSSGASLIIGSVFINTSGTLSSINSGFTITDNVAPSGGKLGIGCAYLIETAIAAQNPTWTFSGSLAWAAESAVFKQ